MCLVEYSTDVYPNGARDGRKSVFLCAHSDGRNLCGNGQHRNIGQRFLGVSQAPAAPSPPQPSRPTMGPVPGMQTRPPTPMPIPVPKKPPKNSVKRYKDLEVVVDFHIPFTRRRKKESKDRRTEIIHIQPASSPPAARPPPAQADRPPPTQVNRPPAQANQPPPPPPQATQPFPAQATQPLPPQATQPLPAQTHRPASGQANQAPPSQASQPLPQRRQSPHPTVVHHHYHSDSSETPSPIREHGRRGPVWVAPRPRDDTHVEINRERDRRRRAEAEREMAEDDRRRAEAKARRADAVRREAEEEAARTRMELEMERDQASRARELRSRVRLEEIEAQRIGAERIRRAEHDQLEAERVQHEMRLRGAWAHRAPPLLHQNYGEGRRVHGDLVLDEAIEDSRWMDEERRALDEGVFRRVRVGVGPPLRRRDTTGARERVVYEDEYRRRWFG